MGDPVQTSAVVTKAPWESKTLWVNVLVAASAFIPAVQAYITANPQVFTWVFVVVNIALRFLTQGKIQIGD